VGDQDALDQMMMYNEHDVKILEDLYLILRPWISNHPNMGLFIESNKPVCSTCGHETFEYIGDYVTNLSKFPGHRCDSCGSIFRERKSVIPKQVRKHLMSPVEMVR